MSALLVALHDVAPRHLQALRRLRESLHAWGVSRATLLLVPEMHGEARLDSSRECLDWLAGRLAAGDEPALHGHYHRARGVAGRLRDRLHAAAVTAGEGECLTLDEQATRRMLRDERARLERALGVRLHGFVAPAWLEPPGFAETLRAAGYAWHETAAWVHWLAAQPAGDVRLFSPVIGFATRTPLRKVASLAWARALRPVAAASGALGVAPARVAIHPADATSPAVMARMERVVRALAERLPVRTYAELVPPRAAAAAVESRMSARRCVVHAAE